MSAPRVYSDPELTRVAAEAAATLARMGEKIERLLQLLERRPC